MNPRSAETSAKQSANRAVVQRAATEEMRSRSSIIDPDYLDLFVLIGDLPVWSPEQWARALFEEVAGRTGQFVWRVLLGLRLSGRGSGGHVAGWTIGACNDRWVRLEASGRWLTGNLLVEATDREVSMATVVGWHGRWGSLLWQILSKVHRHEAPGLLREAAALPKPGHRPPEPRAPADG